MTITDIRDRIIIEIKHRLGSDANRSGAVLYNGWDILRHSNGLYIMGFNPGGDPSKSKVSVIDSLEEIEDSYCSYEDECWRNSCPKDCRNKEHFGISRHQNRVKQLAQVLGYNIREAFAVNAIFVRSEKQSKLEASQELFEKCWPVHQVFFSIVRPKIILCLGNGGQASAFAFLRKKLAPDGKPSSDSIKVFQGTITLDGNNIKTRVIGVRHPSYPWFDPSKDLRSYLQLNPDVIAGQ